MQTLIRPVRRWFSAVSSAMFGASVFDQMWTWFN
jgi:hypothetical protein